MQKGVDSITSEQSVLTNLLNRDATWVKANSNLQLSSRQQASSILQVVCVTNIQFHRTTNWFGQISHLQIKLVLLCYYYHAEPNSITTCQFLSHF